MTSAHPLQCDALYILFIFDEYWRQPCMDDRDSCIISYFTWLTIEHTIKKIAQSESVTEIDSTR